MAISPPQLQQRLPFVDNQGRLSNEGLRALNDALGSLFNQIQQIAELYGITDALNSDLTALAGSGVVLAQAGGFDSGRVLTSTPTITVTDGGAGSTITAAFSGDTDDVPEGANLYFTNARARSALSGSTGISYNAVAGSIAVATNGIADALLRQSSAFSIIGRGGNTTGNVADITAANDGEVLRRSGATLGFGAVDLSSANGVAGILAATRGGTGYGSYTAGDLLFASGASALSKLAIGTNNYVLTSDGTSPVWTANTGTSSVVRATRPQFTNTIGVGAAASASGSGVSFPATQSASTDPNTLDDYEEGTWTPTVTALSGAITSYTATGSYTKIGNVVVATVDVTITNSGTGGGSVIVSLPFNPGGVKIYGGAGREAALGGQMLQLFAAGGGSTVSVQTYNGGYPGATGSRVTGTVVYNT